jgi:hypothetical protein
MVIEVDGEMLPVTFAVVVEANPLVDTIEICPLTEVLL